MLSVIGAVLVLGTRAAAPVRMLVEPFGMRARDPIRILLRPPLSVMPLMVIVVRTIVLIAPLRICRRSVSVIPPDPIALAKLAEIHALVELPRPVCSVEITKAFADTKALMYGTFAGGFALEPGKGVSAFHPPLKRQRGGAR
jgi:hypothetical protein